MSKIKTISKSLKHQIKFLKNLAQGQIDEEKWDEQYTSFASIFPISEVKFESIENIDFGHVMSGNYFMFKIRFLQNITTKLRISFKDRLFEIKRIINIGEQDRFLKIICLEI